MGQPHLEAAKLKEKLNELIALAAKVETKLADKLRAIAKPLAKIENGTVVQRNNLLRDLKEILADSEIWLCYRIGTPEEKQQLQDLLSPVNRYWYFVVFPTWCKKYDEDFEKWKKSLIQGEAKPTDAVVIGEIGRRIAKYKRENKDYKYRQAEMLSKLIADKAMDTDLIATGSRNNPLCVQLTTLNKEYTAKNKIPEWEKTLRYWEIKRGLFASYNPQKLYYIDRLINKILPGADDIKEGYYPPENL